MVENLYSKNKGFVFMPIYVPGETYSFYLNGDPITDPNFDTLKLQLWDDADNVVNNDVADLIKVKLFNDTTGSIYHIACKFEFPIVLDGRYYFVIVDSANNDIVRSKSQQILVAGNEVQKTTLVAYSNNDPLYGIDWGNADLPEGFTINVRVVLSRADYQFESEKTQYRNVSDRKLRTLKSYRDDVIKVESQQFDIYAHEAMSAILEHDNIWLNSKPISVKSTYTVDGDISSETSKGSFEAYLLDEDGVNDFFYGYDTLIVSGDAFINPELIYDNDFFS